MELFLWEKPLGTMDSKDGTKHSWEMGLPGCCIQLHLDSSHQGYGMKEWTCSPQSSSIFSLNAVPLCSTFGSTMKPEKDNHLYILYINYTNID